MKKSLRITAVLLAASAALLILASCSGAGSTESESEDTETYDWGTLAPDEPEEKADFSFDKYLRSLPYAGSPTATADESYTALVDAVENRTEKICVPAEDRDFIVSALFDSYLPAALLSGISGLDYDEVIETESETVGEETAPAVETAAPAPEDSSGEIIETETELNVRKMTELTLAFRYEAEDHKAALDFFYSSAAVILSKTVKEGMSETEKALSIYSWTAANIEDAASNGISAFDVIASKGGRPSGEAVYSSSGATHAGAFQYLALQAGLRCASVSSAIRQGSGAWNTVELDGEYFHVNAAYEYTDTSGSGLMWFGKKDSDMTAEGFGAEFVFGYNFAEGIPAYGIQIQPGVFGASCVSGRFDVLAGCSYYEKDSEGITYYDIAAGTQGKLTF